MDNVFYTAIATEFRMAELHMFIHFPSHAAALTQRGIFLEKQMSRIGLGLMIIILTSWMTIK